ncbi:HAD family hydrolase [Streptomyces sp. NPDC003952]
MTLSAVIFGFDGTLVDSHEAHFLARHEAFGGLGLVLDRAWYDAHAGASLDEAVALLAAEQDIRVTESMQEIDGRCTEAYLGHLDQVRPISWVVAFAESLKGHLPIAVASGSSETMIRTTMKAAGIDDLFPVVVTREDVSRGKPSPELFLKAAERMALLPTQCLVVDYSNEGIEAAHQAQMPIINVRGK